MALIIRNPTVDLPRLLSSCKKNKNNNIQKVVLDRCLITPDHALLLKEALLQTTTLTVLYLFGTTWASPKAFHEMTRGLAGNTTLQILYLCGDTSLTMSVLGPALADNTSIQELYLWDNQLTDDDAVILAATVLGSASYCCTESDDEGPNTTKSATNVNKLMKLHVPRNNIGSRGANALIAAAAAHPTLQELHLSHNTLVHLSDTSLPKGKISETTTASNATSNQQNQLHALHLDGNPMLDIAQVARVLSKNPRVRHLNLGNCLVEVKGCLALASAMRTNTNLQTLSIRKALVSNRNNEIPSSQEQQDTVEAAFVSVLRHDNRTLLELDIATTAATVPAILHYLEFNKTGRHLLAQDDLLLWPLVLQKVAHKPALLHEFISAKPEWFQR